MARLCTTWGSRMLNPQGYQRLTSDSGFKFTVSHQQRLKVWMLMVCAKQKGALLKTITGRETWVKVRDKRKGRGAPEEGRQKQPLSFRALRAFIGLRQRPWDWLILAGQANTGLPHTMPLQPVRGTIVITFPVHLWLTLLAIGLNCLLAVSLLARVAPFWPCRCLSAVNCTKRSLILVDTEKKLFLVTSYLTPSLWGGLEWSPRQRNLVSRYPGQLTLAALEARLWGKTMGTEPP